MINARPHFPSLTPPISFGGQLMRGLGGGGTVDDNNDGEDDEGAVDIITEFLEGGLTRTSILFRSLSRKS